MGVESSGELNVLYCLSPCSLEVLILFKLKIDPEIELKMLKPEDAEDLFILVESCREYLNRWLPWIAGTTSTEQTEEFISFAQNQLAQQEGYQAGLWYRGELAGTAGFVYIDKVNRSGSIGYWLGEKYQGRGIMTRTCRALIKYAFEELNLERISIRCAEENHRSRAIPERLGFVCRGSAKKAEWLPNVIVDHLVYVLTRQEWASRLKDNIEIK